MNFGDKLIEQRKSKKLSQEQLADKMGVSRQAVSRWEAGNALPDVTNLKKISELFEVSTDYLLNDSLVLGSDPNAANDEEKKKVKVGKLCRISLFLTLFGVIGICLLFILSSVIPAVEMVPAHVTAEADSIKKAGISTDSREADRVSDAESVLYVQKKVYSFFPFLSYYHLRVVAVGCTIMMTGGIILGVYVKKTLK